MTSPISSGAAAAREGARQGDGKFGTQPLESIGLTLEPSPPAGKPVRADELLAAIVERNLSVDLSPVRRDFPCPHEEGDATCESCESAEIEAEYELGIIEGAQREADGVVLLVTNQGDIAVPDDYTLYVTDHDSEPVPEASPEDAQCPRHGGKWGAKAGCSLCSGAQPRDADEAKHLEKMREFGASGVELFASPGREGDAAYSIVFGREPRDAYEQDLGKDLARQFALGALGAKPVRDGSLSDAGLEAAHARMIAAIESGENVVQAESDYEDAKQRHYARQQR